MKRNSPSKEKTGKPEGLIVSEKGDRIIPIPDSAKSLALKINEVDSQRIMVHLNLRDHNDQLVEQSQVEFTLSHQKESQFAQGNEPSFRDFLAPRWRRFHNQIKNLFTKRDLQGEEPGRKSSWTRKLENWLFIAAIVVYLFTRLIDLPKFPIYFFTDEAVQTVLAGDFVRDGLHNYDKELLPTYFVNGNQYNLGSSVYMQVIPFLLFGKSIWVTRGTAVLATLMAAFAVGLILKNIFKSKYYWAATLFLSITPAWFLHSRTAFETTLAVSFFAIFIYFYLMYRYRNPNYLYPAVVMAALCFYSYSPAQMVIGLLAIILWFSDLRYHWQHKKTVFIALGVILVLAIPYIRFLVMHPGENYQHLLILQSYWLSSLTVGQKLLRFLQEYVHGLNPLYWYVPNSTDFIRHLMKGYGHILIYTIPFFIIGLVACVRNFRQSSYRLLLFAMLAAPAGAALVELGITRALFMVIPVALITALGLHVFLNWLEHLHIPSFALALPVLGILVAVNGFMTWDALNNGPTWYQDYGLGGMQYGASQLFGEVKKYIQDNPQAMLVVSPSWANGTDVVARFFFKDPLPFQMGSVEGYIEHKQDISPQTVFVSIPEEYKKILESQKFNDIQIKEVLPYPNGDPGFYFLTLRYVDNIDEIFAREHILRQELITELVTLPNGSIITVSHSPFDMGQISDMFDGNNNTVTRTAEANPMRINIDFGGQRALNGVTVRVGGVKSRVTVTIYPTTESTSEVFTLDKEQTADPRDMEISFGKTIQTSRMDIEVLSVNDTEPAHVHVWEVTFW